MKKKLILVGAPPACGKNYISEQICKEIKHIVYLDKDDLADLLRASFTLCGETPNMDGEFYAKHLHAVEYSTLLRLAFSALRFEDLVLVNAPFLKEVRNAEYMRSVKTRAEAMNAELVFIWITAPIEVCYERMKKRNSDRDALKLAQWSEYVKKIDYSAPLFLEETGVIDRLIVFNNKNDDTARISLQKTLEVLNK